MSSKKLGKEGLGLVWNKVFSLVKSVTGDVDVSGKGTLQSQLEAHTSDENNPHGIINAILGNGYGQCGTAGSITDKTVSLTGYVLKNGFVAIKFTSGVPADSTLNINGKGAKPIYYNNAAITNNILRKGDTGFFAYYASKYHLIAKVNSSQLSLSTDVAISASSAENAPDTIEDTQYFLGCDNSNMYRFTPEIVLKYLQDNLDLTDVAENITEILAIGNKKERSFAQNSNIKFWEEGGAYIRSSTPSPTGGVLYDILQFYVSDGSSLFNILTLNGNSASNYSICSGIDNKSDLGEENKRFKTVYTSTGTATTSDRNKKKDIVSLDADKTIEFIMGLNPVSYKFVDGTSGRTHHGLVAQDVEELLEKLGMTSKDFAGFIKSEKKEMVEVPQEDGTVITEERVIEGEFVYLLRYEELIADLIKAAQVQQAKITEQEERIAKLEARYAELAQKSS